MFRLRSIFMSFSPFICDLVFLFFFVLNEMILQYLCSKDWYDTLKGFLKSHFDRESLTTFPRRQKVPKEDKLPIELNSQSELIRHIVGDKYKPQYTVRPLISVFFGNTQWLNSVYQWISENCKILHHSLSLHYINA